MSDTMFRGLVQPTVCSKKDLLVMFTQLTDLELVTLSEMKKVLCLLVFIVTDAGPVITEP